jgi:hypothetical protein
MMENIYEYPMSVKVKSYISLVMAIAARVYHMDALLYRETLEYYISYDWHSKQIHTFAIFDPESDGEYGSNLRVEILDSTGNYRWRIERFYCAAIYGQYEEYASPWEYSFPVVTRRSNRSSRKHGKWRLLNVWE